MLNLKKQTKKILILEKLVQLENTILPIMKIYIGKHSGTVKQGVQIYRVCKTAIGQLSTILGPHPTLSALIYAS